MKSTRLIAGPWLQSIKLPRLPHSDRAFLNSTTVFPASLEKPLLSRTDFEACGPGSGPVSAVLKLEESAKDKCRVIRID